MQSQCHSLFTCWLQDSLLAVTRINGWSNIKTMIGHNSKSIKCLPRAYQNLWCIYCNSWYKGTKGFLLLLPYSVFWIQVELVRFLPLLHLIFFLQDCVLSSKSNEIMYPVTGLFSSCTSYSCCLRCADGLEGDVQLVESTEGPLLPMWKTQKNTKQTKQSGTGVYPMLFNTSVNMRGL